MIDKDFKWYVVKVISTREKKVKTTIEREITRSDQSDKINEVVCPVTLVGEIKDGKKVIVEKVLWLIWYACHAAISEYPGINRYPSSILGNKSK